MPGFREPGENLDEIRAFIHKSNWCSCQLCQDGSSLPLLELEKTAKQSHCAENDSK
jgi:hypothetical protein